MATNRIEIETVLTVGELQALAAFAAENRGNVSVVPLSAFLKDSFDVDLVLEPSIIEGYKEDSSHLPSEADGLCRPRDERECAIIMRACYACGILMTLSGGRSNLTGSATPEGGVVISTARLITPSVSVDAEQQMAAAPVGQNFEEVRDAILAKSGETLCLPVDPTSRGDAALGGVLACNASGFTPGETGSIRSWVRRLRLTLPNGHVVDATRGQYVSENGAFILVDGESESVWSVPRYARPAIKNAAGPFSAPDGCLDFVDLVVGAEGLFGLVTTCELALAPKPSDYLDLFFSLPTEGEALKVRDCVSARCSGDFSGFSAFEYFGVNCRKMMDHETRFFHGEDTVAIYLQQPLHGQDAEDVAMEWMEVLLESGVELDENAILMLDSSALRTLFLEARHSLPANALETVQHRGTYTIMTDTVVPAERFAEFLDFTHALLQEQSLDYVAFGHLGDCHLHFTVLPEMHQLERGVAAYDTIVAKSAELGGVYSGEHGTGKRKRKDFLRCYGPEAVEQVKRCKAAVDPEFLLNRGDVFEVV